MPTPKLRFQEQKSPKSGTQHNFPEHTTASVSPHYLNKSGYQIFRENHRAIYIVHLPYQFCAAENAVCQSRSTVRQFNHFITLLHTSEFTQVSPFSSTMAKGHFSWCTFLMFGNVSFSLEMVLQVCNQ